MKTIKTSELKNKLPMNCFGVVNDSIEWQWMFIGHLNTEDNFNLEIKGFIIYIGEFVSDIPLMDLITNFAKDFPKRKSAARLPFYTFSEVIVFGPEEKKILVKEIFEAKR